jgi:16S rRNA (cytosine1402-N4)-methyltransferase
MTVSGEHCPVLLQKVLEIFECSTVAQHSDGWILDGTFGRGGHSRALLNHFPNLNVLALDKDTAAIEHGQSLGLKQLHLLHDSFAHLVDVVGARKLGGVLLDLGVSSPQLDTAERGFSFSKLGPLDMRMNQQQKLTAADLLRTKTEKELADIFFYYGEERKSRRIARQIVQNRSAFQTTKDLAQLVQRCVPTKFGQIHPATRVFQALRIAVNDELKELEQGLQQALSVLQPGGALVVISFHSLEDRIVKHFFKQTRPFWQEVSPKPLMACPEECQENPRARSAKLRFGVRNDEKFLT